MPRLAPVTTAARPRSLAHPRALRRHSLRQRHRALPDQPRRQDHQDRVQHQPESPLVDPQQHLPPGQRACEAEGDHSGDDNQIGAEGEAEQREGDDFQQVLRRHAGGIRGDIGDAPEVLRLDIGGDEGAGGAEEHRQKARHSAGCPCRATQERRRHCHDRPQDEGADGDPHPRRRQLDDQQPAERDADDAADQERQQHGARDVRPQDQRPPGVRAELHDPVHRDQRRRRQHARQDRQQHDAAAEPEGRGDERGAEAGAHQREGCGPADLGRQQLVEQGGSPIALPYQPVARQRRQAVPGDGRRSGARRQRSFGGPDMGKVVAGEGLEPSTSGL